MAYRGHRGRRGKESLEQRKARQFCFENSKYDPKLQERIFIKTPIETACFLGAAAVEVPDTPQGLVLTDIHGTGAFQLSYVGTKSRTHNKQNLP
jgi:hypothetical protein